jgi:predicted ATP-dependent serine protease
MKLDISIDGIQFGTSLADVSVPAELRVKRPSGREEWDIALGGKGLTPSMIALFTGTPGAGKTTEMLTVAGFYSAVGCNVLYNTAEESAFQLRMTWDRLQLPHAPLIGQVGNVRDLTKMADEVRMRAPEKPFILIQDSLQTLDDGHFKSGRITTATAERSCQHLTNWTKKKLDDVPDDVAYPNSILIGQVNKSGKMAGSNKLKHMVDALIHMSVEEDEKSTWFDCRKLFTEKNRFGGAGAMTFLRMGRHGLTLVGKVEQTLHG